MMVYHHVFKNYLKVVKKFEKGLIAKYKLIGQISLGMIISYWIYNTPEYANIVSSTSIPFLKNYTIDFGLFYPLIIILVITGTSNAVNLTDGLDGLATVPVMLVALSFTLICYVVGNTVFSEYLKIPYIINVGEASIFCGSIVGSCL